MDKKMRDEKSAVFRIQNLDDYEEYMKQFKKRPALRDLKDEDFIERSRLFINIWKQQIQKYNYRGPERQRINSLISAQSHRMNQKILH